MEENKLAVKPLGLLMLELSIPAIIAQLVSIIYNMVDRIFIGRIENGTNAMAALSVPLFARLGFQEPGLLAALFFVARGAYLLNKFSRRRDELIQKLLKLKR